MGGGGGGVCVLKGDLCPSLAALHPPSFRPSAISHPARRGLGLAGVPSSDLFYNRSN